MGEDYIEKTRAYEEATGMVCEIINNNGIIGGRTCKTSPETMKKKLEKIKQEKEAGTNLNCEIDEESNGLVCIGQTVGAETVAVDSHGDYVLKETKADEEATGAETVAGDNHAENLLKKTKAYEKATGR